MLCGYLLPCRARASGIYGSCNKEEGLGRRTREVDYMIWIARSNVCLPVVDHLRLSEKSAELRGHGQPTYILCFDNFGPTALISINASHTSVSQFGVIFPFGAEAKSSKDMFLHNKTTSPCKSFALASLSSYQNFFILNIWNVCRRKTENEVEEQVEFTTFSTYMNK